MNEKVIKSLVEIFAIIATYSNYNEKNTEIIKEHLFLFFKKHLNQIFAQRYIELFEQNVKKLIEDPNYFKPTKITLKFTKIYRLALELNSRLTFDEKIWLIIRYIEFFYLDWNLSQLEKEILQALVEIFNIDVNDFNTIINFLEEKYSALSKENFTIVGQADFCKNLNCNFIEEKNLDKPIFFIYLKNSNQILFQYKGEQKLLLQSSFILPNIIYSFDKGTVIKGATIKPIYFYSIISSFRAESFYNIQLLAKDIEFYFSKKQIGFHKATFSFETGQLVGIMGQSGSGKTTLLNILCGLYKPTYGEVLINGINLHKNIDKLSHYIGLVPQDDILIEELTVWQNLYFTAKMIYGNLSEKEIHQKVENTLKDLDLFTVKDLKVGNPLEKFISGGQRKRLNIALELIREPYILFLDEPTSGLSSLDAQVIINILKNLTLKGKIVIVNIHQPSSDIFKNFDKIIILDKGGYVVFVGHTSEALPYFKEINNYVDYQYFECESCGNIKTDQILEFIDERINDESGFPTSQRLVSPREWYTLFKVNLEKRSKIKIITDQLPNVNLKNSHPFVQFIVNFKRTTLSKIQDWQYLLVNLFEAPVLAFVLAFFTKKYTDGQYIFYENSNIPVFLFMIVIVAIFLGLSCSSEELIKDRKIILRERFLNLNSLSYIASKIFYLSLLSFYQSFIFLTLVFFILKIPANFLIFLLLMFLTSLSSILLGLFLSTFVKNIVTVYILIPLILVPQMLLGGAMIKFEDMSPLLSSPINKPNFLSNLCFSRWTYEALCVETFLNNDYQKIFYKIEKPIIYSNVLSGYILPKLKTEIQNYHDKYSYVLTKKTIKYYLETFSVDDIKKFEDYFDTLSYRHFSENAEEIISQVNNLKILISGVENYFSSLRDSIVRNYNQIGPTILSELKKRSVNKKLDEIVNNKTSLKFIVEKDTLLYINHYFPYLPAKSKIGNEPMYSSTKKIWGWEISTITFNSIILIAFTLLLFISLYVKMLSVNSSKFFEKN